MHFYRRVVLYQNSEPREINVMKKIQKRKKIVMHHQISMHHSLISYEICKTTTTIFRR